MMSEEHDTSQIDDSSADCPSPEKGKGSMMRDTAPDAPAVMSPTRECPTEVISTQDSTSQSEDAGTPAEEGKEAFLESEGWEIPDDIPKVDPEAIDKLVLGTMSNILPEFQKAKSSLGELTENQRILIETVIGENKKFSECKSLAEVTEMMDKAKAYYIKLLNIKKEMVMLHEKSAKLKRRALKLQQQKQKEALQREQEREKELEKERLLIAKPTKTSHHTV